MRVKNIYPDGRVVYTEEELKEPIEIPASILNYEETVTELIRRRYSLDNELSISRQRDSKPDEFKEYYDYCESCKKDAKSLIETQQVQ